MVLTGFDSEIAPIPDSRGDIGGEWRKAKPGVDTQIVGENRIIRIGETLAGDELPS